jgi:acetyltransferase-like isoleucine patch superfamily enzyme
MSAERRPFVGHYQAIAPDVKLGKGVRLSSFVNLYGCDLGDEVTLGAFVEIQKGVVVGDRCKIGSHTFICEGVTIGAESFIGHGVMFINDKYPVAVNEEGRVADEGDWIVQRTNVGSRVSIGSNATILGGIEIGDGVLIGAGSVVTRDIPAGLKAVGAPARVVGPSALRQ